MRDKAAAFDGKAKIFSDGVAPIGEGFRSRQVIETIVDFHGIEMIGVERKHLPIRQATRIKPTKPVFVIPTRSTDIDFAGHVKRFVFRNFKRLNLALQVVESVASILQFCYALNRVLKCFDSACPQAIQRCSF